MQVKGDKKWDTEYWGGGFQFGAEKEVNREEEVGKRQNHQGSLIKLQSSLIKIHTTLYFPNYVLHTYMQEITHKQNKKKYKKKVLAKQAWGLEFQS